MTTNSVRVSGLTASTTEQVLRDFLSYCGNITSVHFDPLNNDGSRSAIVTFESPDCVPVAELITGATVGDATVTIGAVEASPLHKPLSSATKWVQSVVDSGKIKGEQFVGVVKQRAAVLDERYGLCAAAVEGVQVVKKASVSAVQQGVAFVSGPEISGKPTTETWMYGTQPQWGPKPQW